MPVDPTIGSVGGIDRAAWPFWRSVVNRVQNVSSANIRTAMAKLFYATQRGTDKVDLVIMDDIFYGYLDDALETNQRFARTGGKMAKAGFESIVYKGGAEVVMASGQGGACPPETAFFINTNHLKWRPHVDRNMVFMDTGKPIDQDAVIKWLRFAGNMCSDNLSLQGRLIQGA